MKKKLAAGFYSFLFFYFSSDKHCVIVQLWKTREEGEEEEVVAVLRSQADKSRVYTQEAGFHLFFFPFSTHKNFFSFIN
jgi:hypothetical protein